MNDELMTIEQVSEGLPIEALKNHVKKIQDVMKAIMIEDTHYGVIPGTNKPSLLKAGAEKLGFTFRLVAEFDVRRNDLENGHREYEVICTLRHMTTENVVGQGVGNCSTMESKYRYRNDYIDTGKPVPGSYWKDRDPSVLGGKGYQTKKIEGQWKVVEARKIENPDIADVYNTVLKMAKKRAHVDAMITACAASDIFTQDVEDFEEKPSQEGPPAEKKPAGDQRKNKDNGNGERAKKREVFDEIIEILKSDYFSDEERQEFKKAFSEDWSLDVMKAYKEKISKQLTDREEQQETLDETAEKGWDGEYEGTVEDDPSQQELY